MIEEQFSRTGLLIGAEGIDKLKKSRVAVFGVGGVGGFVVEALVRSGIGEIDLIDNDTVALSNLNRQIIATRSSVGRYKVDVFEERIRDINPDCVVHKYPVFYLPDTADQFPFEEYDYVVDAIDTVTGKIGLVMQAEASGTKIISAMGAGNKMDPTAFCVTDIYKTNVCPLAKVMRRELKKRGIKKLKVVYSEEKARTPLDLSPAAGTREQEEIQEKVAGRRKIAPGSIAYVPSVAGLIIAGEVIKDLIGAS